MSAKKPVEARQRRGTPDVGGVAASEGRPVPVAEGSWREGTVERWVSFWASPLASQVEQSDEGAFRRLFKLYDELDRLWEAIDDTGRVVPGSQGQPRPNPLFKQVEAFQAEARQLEDRFGLSPLSRLRLGITFADAQASLDGLNARLAAKLAEQDDDLWAEFDEG
ncbi:MAG TPA: P27 family phage terminase small subunit [Acidimicrobiia bacterium]